MTSTELIDRMLDPVARGIGEEAAKKLVDLRYDPELEKCIESLGELANEGQLHAEQRADYQLILEINDVVSILRLKARAALASATSAA
jgi:hypothetical protein